MANFRTHFHFGILSGLLAGISPFLLLKGFYPNLFFLAVFFGYLGAMVPDLDHDIGRSLSFVFSQFTTVLPAMIFCLFLTSSSGWSYSLLLFLLLFHQLFFKLTEYLFPDKNKHPERRFSLKAAFRSFLISILGGVITIAVTQPTWGILPGFGFFVLIAFLVQLGLPLFRRITIHRGLFHSVPAMLIFSELSYLYLYQLTFSHRMIVTGAAFLGIFSHLALDEIYSIDLEGRRIKQSFGTALSLWKPKTPYLSTLAYSIAGILFVACLLTTR